jgi:hypothetical protein
LCHCAAGENVDDFIDDVAEEEKDGGVVVVVLVTTTSRSDDDDVVVVLSCVVDLNICCGRLLLLLDIEKQLTDGT